MIFDFLGHEGSSVRLFSSAERMESEGKKRSLNELLSSVKVTPRAKHQRLDSPESPKEAAFSSNPQTPLEPLSVGPSPAPSPAPSSPMAFSSPLRSQSLTEPEQSSVPSSPLLTSDLRTCKYSGLRMKGIFHLFPMHLHVLPACCSRFRANFRLFWLYARSDSAEGKWDSVKNEFYSGMLNRRYVALRELSEKANDLQSLEFGSQHAQHSATQTYRAAQRHTAPHRHTESRRAAQ
jgi:hypothetical protein